MRRLLPLFALGALVAFQALPAHAADGDNDHVVDELDVCPTVSDPFQGDVDGDGVGDLCESGATGVTTFAGTPEGELIIGTSGNDTLSGAGGADALYGLEGDDTLNGGDGRDFLSGGPGVDTLTGGASCDVFAFDPAGDDDVITDFDPALDRMSFPSPGEESSDDPLADATFGGDDHLVVTFGEGDNAATLDFPGLPAGAELVLTSGPCFTPPIEDDEIVPPEEPEEPPFECGEPVGIFLPPPLEADLPLDGMQVFGTNGDDTLEGTDCSDLIVGDATLSLEEPESPEPDPEVECVDDVCGSDVINGLDGNDLIIGDKAFLTDFERGGNDTIHGGDGDDVILGDAAIIADCLCGGSGGSGAAGFDGPVGGNDLLYGDEGDDLIIGDALLGLSGQAYGGYDYLSGGDGDDYLIGDGVIISYGAIGGDDILDGGDGDDYLIGDAMIAIDEFSVGGNDTLIGGAGDDFLAGDAEIVDGDAGSDTFVFDAGTDFGNDIIADAGNGEVTDTILFTGGGLTSIADLNDRSTVTDDGVDVTAVVFTDTSKTTHAGSIVIWGIGTGTIASWSDISASPALNVVVVP